MSRTATFALALAATAALAPAAEAKCARQELSASLVPQAAGVAIVMIESAVDLDLSADTSTWAVKVDGAEVPPLVDTLAPGLVVYRVPSSAEAAELSVGTKVLAKLARVPLKKPLAAPRVTLVQHSTTSPTMRSRTERTSVTIKGAAPADAVAIVITDDKGTPLSFGRVTAGEALVPYYHGRCGVLPDGTAEPTVGSKVRLFWVDKYGQASAKSAPIRVTKAP